MRVLIPHCVDQMQDHNTEQQQLFGTNRGILLLTAIVLAALFFNAGAIPLFDEDEGAYAQVTQEMLRNGDLVTPRLGGELFFHKPPMIYWTQALSVVVVGTNELAFRLPSIVASMAWAVLLFLFVRRHLDQPTAGLAVFMLVTAMQLSLITRAAIADALLNLFITLTMFALFNYFRAPKKRLILVAYIGMALGFMTKGPIAVVIPVAVSGLFFLSQKQFKTWLRVMFHPAGWAVFLIIALPWYLVLINTHGWHFIREIFLVHNLGRFRSPMEGHSGSVAYYVPVVLVGLLPFTTLLIQALGRIRLALKHSLDQFLWLWFGFVFIFFSLAGTKLHHYVVYGYIPLIILMARAADQQMIKRAGWFVLPPVILLLILFGLKDMVLWILPSVKDQFTVSVAREALPEFGAQYRIMVATVLAGVALTAFAPRIRLVSRVVVTGCLFFALITVVVMPKIADILQGPIKEAALIAKNRNLEVVMWRMNYPSFHVYYGKPAIRRQPEPGDVVITKADQLDRITSHAPIYQRYGIVLTRINRL
jgi:4-amino-4-deoxy-L-arabinose transferase-like glycosyltransferase